MGLENRKNSTNQYFYSKKRVNGRVRSRYFGAGEAARLIAQIEELERQDCDIERMRWREERDRIEQGDKELNELSELADALVAATLLNTGHYQHKGQWRKRRDKSSD